ncbi:flagellar motor switch protein FliG [Aquicoccus sp. SCR17]|nr:flagellar motor switch protein FliG [Carideicomes alvinocaridis]
MSFEGPGSGPPGGDPGVGAPGGTQAGLTRKQKAAIIVRLLLREGADVPVADLPEEMQADLSQQLGAMTYVDRDTLGEVVREFADELDSVGLSFPRGIAGALSVLDGKISPRTAARLRKEAGVRQAGDPWQRIRTLSVEELKPVAEAESIEVTAVLMSMLDTAKAAELMAALPGERARRIAYAISLTGKVTPDAVDRIGLSLASQLDLRPPLAFEAKPGERVGAILNYSPSATREEVLTGLDETDSDFAEEVRRNIFTFAHIPQRVEGRDVPKVVRMLEQDRLVMALAAALQSSLEEAVEFLLENISKRMADGLREEMRDVGKVKAKDGEAAMAAMVSAIRELADSGEIELVSPDEEE